MKFSSDNPASKESCAVGKVTLNIGLYRILAYGLYNVWGADNMSLFVPFDTCKGKVVIKDCDSAKIKFTPKVLEQKTTVNVGGVDIDANVHVIFKESVVDVTLKCVEPGGEKK